MGNPPQILHTSLLTGDNRSVVMHLLRRENVHTIFSVETIIKYLGGV